MQNRIFVLWLSYYCMIIMVGPSFDSSATPNIIITCLELSVVTDEAYSKIRHYGRV
jgi:hypothetical protein